MQKKLVSLGTPILIGIMALALGWFAHAAVPLSAQGEVVDRHAALSDPAAPAAPAAVGGARLTYQGRLTNGSGTPINSPVNATFVLYDRANSPIYTATRTITPINGLFTVYLGDGADPLLDGNTLQKTASIGVTVGGDAEMTPHQALNSVVGHSENNVGVVGSSTSFAGVVGFSNSWVGVSGQSNSGIAVGGYSYSGIGVAGGSNSSIGVRGYSVYTNGVVGITQASDAAGVSASNAYSSGIALEISNGGIKATGAGIGSSTFAFIHKSTSANIASNWTRINNVLTNGDQNAMLFVTHVNNPMGASDNGFTMTLGVYFDVGYNKWTIYREDGLAFPQNATFNVMVIKR